MLFDSRTFLYFFLPLAMVLYYLIARFKVLWLGHSFLIAASLFFYGFWNPAYLPLILLSILFNYQTGKMIHVSPKPKLPLAFGIILNLAVLAYFKYSNFFLENISALLRINTPVLNVILPLGISFYTFTQIAYLVDIYQKKTKPCGLFEYALFVVFFPHLIAGPIVHYSNLMPQFRNPESLKGDAQKLFLGFFFFVTGLFQKTACADPFASLANTGFAQSSSLGFGDAWISLFAYTIQIYFDFAGYSNMAIGLALFFNVEFPVNFNSPYQASSIIDFWKRWHITLSTFLRDYVYIPLGGNRKGEGKKYVYIFTTMLVGGFWHGAQWTFILWGCYHGVLIVANHLLRKLGFKISAFAGKLFTFLLVIYGWVLFKSENMAQAWNMTKALFYPGHLNAPSLWDSPFQTWYLPIVLAAALFLPNAQWWAKKIRPSPASCLGLSLLFIVCFILINKQLSPKIFLYWQF